eukprot:2592496-Amphidinium_carterae.1
MKLTSAGQLVLQQSGSSEDCAHALPAVADGANNSIGRWRPSQRLSPLCQENSSTTLISMCSQHFLHKSSGCPLSLAWSAAPSSMARQHLASPPLFHVWLRCLGPLRSHGHHAMRMLAEESAAAIRASNGRARVAPSFACLAKWGDGAVRFTH